MNSPANAHAALCWEYGAGLGHIATLKTIASELKNEGWKTTLVGPMGFSAPANHPFDQITRLPAPKDIANTLEPPATEEIASFNHTVWIFGYHSPKFVFTRIQLWAELFDRIKPNLVIADYAPGALMAAIGRIPSIATGNGYSLPPVELQRFPRYHKIPDVIDQDLLLSSLNKGLQLTGRKGIGHLPELFRADFQACATFELIDPYRNIRTQPVLGPLFSREIPRYQAQKSERIFVYLTHCHPEILENVVRALSMLEVPVDLYALQAAQTDIKSLASENITLVDETVSLEEIISSYSLVVHLGGHGFTTELLAAGMPQVLLTLDIEKVLFGIQLERENLAAVYRIDLGADLEEILSVIRKALDDDGLRTNVQKFADMYPSNLHRAPLKRIIRQSLALAH